MDEQDSVFERFFRGQLAASGQTPGTGLGLSIAQAIVEAHGGEISLHSAGSGSAFEVRMPGSSLHGYPPISPRAAVAGTAAAAQGHPRRPRWISLIGSEPGGWLRVLPRTLCPKDIL